MINLHTVEKHLKKVEILANRLANVENDTISTRCRIPHFSVVIRPKNDHYVDKETFEISIFPMSRDAFRRPWPHNSIRRWSFLPRQQNARLRPIAALAGKMNGYVPSIILLQPADEKLR